MVDIYFLQKYSNDLPLLHKLPDPEAFRPNNLTHNKCNEVNKKVYQNAGKIILG